jgi:hypothetical protein
MDNSTKYSTLVKNDLFNSKYCFDGKCSFKYNGYTKVINYQNALAGNKTNVYNKTVSAPIGTRVWKNTYYKCPNYPKEDIYIFVDTKPSTGKSIYDSVNNDINYNPTTYANCVKKTKTTINVGGKKKKETRYTLDTFQNMNTGHQFFISSVAVLGLFLFYKAFFKPLHF